MKKKMNGWLVIAVCFGALMAAAGAIILIGQFG